ncbi:hypothetical protein TEA_026563 [Camellia sinensis var. sinensis]|uniref:Exocyst complex component SEC5 n=1 Tax=Camellia sinensis var. sinensis TaxID=542762 RepID=A0A4S4DML7_CAMSN|nr:hypothetical protein TEA_026563 [Camellia sinensis var. sinensis]
MFSFPTLANVLKVIPHFQVGILKRVLEEVEKVMHEFKGMLYKAMEDPQIDLTNLENIVRLLLELEPESDPVWHYLNIQNHRIRGLLEKCTFDHEARMEIFQNEMHEKALSDAKWKQIQQDLNQSSDVDYSLTSGNTLLLGDSQPIGFTGAEVDALRGRYIRRLTAVLIHHIPAFWKVALSVSSGKFAKSSQVSTDSNVNTSANRSVEKVGDGKYSSHSLDEVSGMIRSTISAYESKDGLGGSVDVYSILSHDLFQIKARLSSSYFLLHRRAATSPWPPAGPQPIPLEFSTHTLITLHVLHPPRFHALLSHLRTSPNSSISPSCQFDHPMGTLSYSPSTSSLADMPVAPYPVGSSKGTLAPSSSSSELRPEFMSGSHKDAPALSTRMSSSMSSWLQEDALACCTEIP